MTDTVDLPDRRVFWQWVWSSVRPAVGWVLALLGGLALLLGWYGVSGEALTAKQLPYLVSGGLTGVGLLVLGAAFLATDDVRRQLDRLGEVERKVDDLYALFAADIADPAVGAAARVTTALDTPEVVALPGGTSFHRRDCGLVAGKAGLEPIDAAAGAQRGLRPCRICEPPKLG